MAMTEGEIYAYNAGYDDAVKDFSMWHPVNRPPKEDAEVVVITSGGWTAARAIYSNGIYYSVVLNKKAYYPSVEYWCYPPEKGRQRQ